MWRGGRRDDVIPNVQRALMTSVFEHAPEGSARASLAFIARS
jgi:hypothetical protein